MPEDGDSEDHPNIFLMTKPTQSGFSPRLRDIKDSFPMPGRYHFRFKCPLIPGTDREKSAVAVWMDCVDEDQHVGVWRNTIFAKVTRINMMDDDDYDFQRERSAPVAHAAHAHAHDRAPVQRTAQHAAPVAPRAHVAQQQQQQPTRPAPPPRADSANLLGVFDAPAPARTSSHQSSAHSSEGNLLDEPVPVQSHYGEASLLDMHGPTPTTYNTGSASNHDDFLGMTSVHTPPVSAPVPVHVPAPAPASYGNPLAGQPRPVAAGNNNPLQTFKKTGAFGDLDWNM